MVAPQDLSNYGVPRRDPEAVTRDWEKRRGGGVLRERGGGRHDGRRELCAGGGGDLGPFEVPHPHRYSCLFYSSGKGLDSH